MINKIILVILFILAFGRSQEYSDTQKSNIPFQVSDSDKKIQVLEKVVLDLKSLVIAQSNIIKNLENSIKKQESKQKKIIEAVINISKKFPKTYLDVLYPPFWSWLTTPTVGQILTHPTSKKVTLKQKSLVTQSLNAHMKANGQHIQLHFFVDNKLIAKSVGHPPSYNYAYFTDIKDYWVNVNFSQEIVLQPGTYVLEFGIFCAGCSSQPVELNGIGYTVKVQEIPDLIPLTNKDF